MAFPSQGYTPSFSSVEISGVAPGINVDSKLAPETVIGEKIGVSVLEDAKVFATDLSPTGLSAGLQHGFTILMCVNNIKGGQEDEVDFEVTFDGGINWCELDEVCEDELKLFPQDASNGIPVKFGDLFNLRFKEDVDIVLLRIGERQC